MNYDRSDQTCTTCDGGGVIAYRSPLGRERTIPCDACDGTGTVTTLTPLPRGKRAPGEPVMTNGTRIGGIATPNNWRARR